MSKDAFYTTFEYLTFNSGTELSIKRHWITAFNIGQTPFIVPFCNGEFLKQSCALIHWDGILSIGSSSVRYLIVCLRDVDYHGTWKHFKALSNWAISRLADFHKVQVLVAISCWLLLLFLVDGYLQKEMQLFNSTVF